MFAFWKGWRFFRGIRYKWNLTEICVRASVSDETLVAFRLKDERKLVSFIDDLQTYLEGRSTTEETCRLYLRKILHLYYKVTSDNIPDQQE